MSLLKKLRSRKSKIVEHTASYFEMCYEKYGNVYYLCFMAPDEKSAKIKAKSNLHMFNGKKIISIKKLDAKNLAAGLTWNKKGIK